MTTPKSPEEIIKEWFEIMLNKNLEPTPEAFEAWLRSSLASVLLWASEQVPRKLGAVCHECDGYDDALDDCKNILINEAKKLTDV